MKSPSIPCALGLLFLECCHSFTLRLDGRATLPSQKTSGRPRPSSLLAAITTPATSTTTTTADVSTTTLDNKPLDVIKSLTEIAIHECGKEDSLNALRDLWELCQDRIPFDFDAHQRQQDDNKYHNNQGLISHLPHLFPKEDRTKFLKLVERMESNGWLSQNPDSVDGLPSLHLNLVSDAQPLFPAEGSSNKDDEDHEFEKGIQELYNVVKPYVYDILLPRVKALLSTKNTPSDDINNLRVSDVFLRRYGQDICGGDRSGISAHYDVFSKVTAVIALDDVAADGRNGLFTTVVDEVTGETSNHKAMRRFFPLQAGDAVVHTWDVLHGVDVEDGLDRTSLIVWFDEFPQGNGEGSKEQDSTVVSPWLSNHPDLKDDAPNDVLQFGLASAIASAEDSESPTKAILPPAAELYLQSAAKRNTFALTRMGSLCEEGALQDDPTMQEAAFAVLESLRTRESLPSTLLEMFDDNTQQELAMRFWLEGAIGGSPLAQKALADEIMLESSSSSSNDDLSACLLAAVLFALAAQQGDQGATESLSRVIDFDVAKRGVESQEAFLASPVVQVANAAIAIAA